MAGAVPTVSVDAGVLSKDPYLMFSILGNISVALPALSTFYIDWSNCWYHRISNLFAPASVNSVRKSGDQNSCDNRGRSVVIETLKYIKVQLVRTRHSAELASIHFAGKVPIHFVRIAVLRAWGASIGKGVVIYHGVEVRTAKRLVIGERTIIGNDAILDARGGLIIGSDVNFSTGVHVWTAQHDWRSPTFPTVSAPVTIGSRSWVSARATILPGTSIGTGSVVAAHALVTKDVPVDVVVAGVPARIIANRPPMDYRLGGRRVKALWW